MVPWVGVGLMLLAISDYFMEPRIPASVAREVGQAFTGMGFLWWARKARIEMRRDKSPEGSTDI